LSALQSSSKAVAQLERKWFIVFDLLLHLLEGEVDDENGDGSDESSDDDDDDADADVQTSSRPLPVMRNAALDFIGRQHKISGRQLRRLVVQAHSGSLVRREGSGKRNSVFDVVNELCHDVTDE